MTKTNQLAIPFVAAIVERIQDGKRQVLIQTRNNIHNVTIYNGTIEFAAGTLDVLYEDVFEAAKREVKEETGINVKSFINEDRKKPVSPQKIDSAFGFRPFCCTQQLKDGRPWVGFIFRCEAENNEPVDQEGESKNVRWIDLADFRKIFENNPEQIFALEYPAWQYYLEEVEDEEVNS